MTNSLNSLIETQLTLAVANASDAMEAAEKAGRAESTMAKYSRAYWAARDNVEAFYAGLQGKAAPRGVCWAWFKGREAAWETFRVSQDRKVA